MLINDSLASRLIASQFPKWKGLSIRPVENDGWDNRSFRLGDDMVVRMPSGAEYATQVEKEHTWLPKLAPSLPLKIPEPLAMGEPGEDYPWKWSIYLWLEGDPASTAQIDNLSDFAAQLAEFLMTLQRIDPTDGPTPGLHNFHRGGSLMTYDDETRHAITLLKDTIDTDKATKVWEEAIATSWDKEPAWVHGDISAGNLLVKDGKLCAVIDFGQLGVGDPACDLAIAWTLFESESREVFQKMVPLDADTWARARGWVLWKFLVVAAGLTDWNAIEARHAGRIIDQILM